MKTFTKNILPVILLLTAFAFIGSSCGGQDDDEDTSTEEYQCDYAGYSTTSNTYVNTPDSDLTTDFFYTSSNGPEVEIYLNSNPGSFNFTTTVVTQNATGTGTLNEGGNTHTVNVTCHKAGNAVGEEFWFEVTGNGINSKFCVTIDQYH